MGNSKKHPNGDQAVTIIENQEVYTGLLTDHDWKLNLILLILIIQLFIGSLTIVRMQWKKTILKSSTSVASSVAVRDVQIGISDHDQKQLEHGTL